MATSEQTEKQQKLENKNGKKNFIDISSEKLSRMQLRKPVYGLKGKSQEKNWISSNNS